ncbi:MAG: hypothetical protein C4345_02865, partial [Chloroflexota bacterium]
MDEPPRRDVAALIIAGFLLLIALPLLWGMAMMVMMGPWMMGGWFGYSSPWWGMAAGVFGVLVILGLGLIAVWAVRGALHGEAHGNQRAIAILQE